MKNFWRSFFQSYSCIGGLLAHAVTFVAFAWVSAGMTTQQIAGPSGLGLTALLFMLWIAFGALGVGLAVWDVFNRKYLTAIISLLLCGTSVVMVPLAMAFADLIRPMFH